jgi:hypothetical protein
MTIKERSRTFVIDHAPITAAKAITVARTETDEASSSVLTNAPKKGEENNSEP